MEEMNFDATRRQQPMKGRMLPKTPTHKVHTLADHKAHEATEGRIEPVDDTE